MAEKRTEQDDSTVVSGDQVISKEERQSLEIEKLRREVHKLGLEARLLSRNARTQFLTALIPTVTTLVAVGGLLLSLYSQNIQNKRTAENRRADDFAMLVRQFSDGKPLASVGAIASLRPYAADPEYRVRVLDLAVSLIGLERNEVVRETIRTFVLTEPDGVTLQALAKQNRFFSGHLSHLAKADRGIPPQFHTWSDNPPEGGAELQTAYEDLGWNIETMVRAINQIKEIENVDLSGVTFSRILSSTDGKPNDAITSRLDSVRFEKGIIFRTVNLERANLAEVTFEETTFRDTNFTGSLLALTDFFDCKFSGSTTFAGFKTELSAFDRTSKKYVFLPPIYAANWYRSTIDVIAFYPALHPEWEDQQEDEQQYFFFFNCTWKVPGVTSPTPPVRKTVTSDPNAPQEAEPTPYRKELILSQSGNGSNFEGRFHMLE